MTKEITELKLTLKEESKAANEKYATLRKQHDTSVKDSKAEISKYADRKIQLEQELLDEQNKVKQIDVKLNE